MLIETCYWFWPLFHTTDRNPTEPVFLDKLTQGKLPFCNLYIIVCDMIRGTEINMWWQFGGQLQN